MLKGARVEIVIGKFNSFFDRKYIGIVIGVVIRYIYIWKGVGD